MPSLENEEFIDPFLWNPISVDNVGNISPSVYLGWNSLLAVVLNLKKKREKKPSLIDCCAIMMLPVILKIMSPVF